MLILNLGILAAMRHVDANAFALFGQRMPSGRRLVWLGFQVSEGELP